MRKKLKIFFLCLASLIVIILLTFIPTLNLKTTNMVELTNEHFIIFYEKQDEDAAIDISNRLQKGYSYISESAGISSKYKTEVYLYNNQNKLHMKIQK